MRVGSPKLMYVARSCIEALESSCSYVCGMAYQRRGSSAQHSGLCGRYDLWRSPLSRLKPPGPLLIPPLWAPERQYHF
jgi:hypothetical protein